MSDRQYTCGNCGTIASEKEFVLDEAGNRVLNCENCGERIKKKRVVVMRPLPDHFSKMPEARFNKRPL
jgi:DNA-directed RNA polymerase subunit RPC12/RpoP